MISKEEAIAKFKEILLAKNSWKMLAKSQFVNHLAIFMSWCLRSALWAVERAKQEYFLSTALNDASVLSHVEDREYIPRKRTYSTGTVKITNNGASAVSIPINTAFLSEAGIGYVTAGAIIILPSACQTINFNQLAKETVIQTVEEAKSFYEILIDAETTKRINSFKVYVDTSGTGNAYEEWEYRRLFQNSEAGDPIYDEFYNHKGQSGIRFGNSYIGTIPPVGSLIKIVLSLTEGDTTLSVGQELFASDDIKDYLGIEANIKAIVETAITGGDAAETIDEMRSNLHYWPVYNEKLVWQDDYEFFIRRSVPGILWIRVWGEEEAEAANGANILNINKVFVSAYATNSTTLGAEIINALEQAPPLNRKYEWVAPAHSQFSVTVTGKVARSESISEVTAAIREKLINDYGKDSTFRKKYVLAKNIYKAINDLKFFDDEEEYFTVDLSGTTTATALNEMVSINETITINLSYL